MAEDDGRNLSAGGKPVLLDRAIHGRAFQSALLKTDLLACRKTMLKIRLKAGLQEMIVSRCGRFWRFFVVFGGFVSFLVTSSWGQIEGSWGNSWFL
ncbi:MAG TPA: hypothetical protein VNA25_15535 [Phycisphaerae bacterium]|nr:hypothetical protein [Phycisphaerae bacterium]